MNNKVCEFEQKLKKENRKFYGILIATDILFIIFCSTLVGTNIYNFVFNEVLSAKISIAISTLNTLIWIAFLFVHIKKYNKNK